MGMYKCIFSFTSENLVNYSPGVFISQSEFDSLNLDEKLKFIKVENDRPSSNSFVPQNDSVIYPTYQNDFSLGVPIDTSSSPELSNFATSNYFDTIVNHDSSLGGGDFSGGGASGEY